MVNRDSYPLSDALRIFPIKHLPKPIGYIHSHYRHAAFIQLPSAKPYSRRLIPDPHSLYLDSRSPLPFGTSLIILIGLHYLTVGFRHQFRRESGGISLAVSLIANLVIHILYTLFAIVYLGSEGLNSLKIGLNLLCSSLVITFLNPYYISLIIGILGLFGIKIAQEQRQAR